MAQIESIFEGLKSKATRKMQEYEFYFDEALDCYVFAAKKVEVKK